MLPATRNRTWTNPAFEVPFTRLRSEVDGLFDRVFGSDGAFQTHWSGLPLAMWEDEDRVFIEAELPGVAESDVEITVHNGMLFIRGEAKPVEGRRYLYNSRTYGRFERVIALPASVSADDVRAKLANGLLSIELSKTPEAKPRKITLQTG